MWNYIRVLLHCFGYSLLSTDCNTPPPLFRQSAFTLYSYPTQLTLIQVTKSQMLTLPCSGRAAPWTLNQVAPSSSLPQLF